MKMVKKLVIYDCDGVLFDSFDAVMAYYDFICEEFGLKKIDRSDKKMVESAMIKTNEEIINLLTDDKKKVSDILEFAKKQNFTKFLNLMKPTKNIKEALYLLKSKGLNIAVFTNRGSSLGYLLKHFDMDRYFDFTVNSFDVTNPKPHPEGLIKILNHFNLTNRDAIFVGDSINDYLPARSTDTDFVAFGNKIENAPVIYDHLEIEGFI
ncbi:HAD-superfamily hydrolase, subfamily IA, variant 1 [Calditerrivibrio nitroreducens DSM 19672]|uniref:phosphoglycolate phosphatase n=2 Tax=Calditerrivibrio nitroreducens TaxID=477976 RepID=E4TIX4_CALNY|nr:HAD-superfamily hydrolase, subfamily IA, variant 1 [Calditerrivibrio nitroreducens DSM 19672]